MKFFLQFNGRFSSKADQIARFLAKNHPGSSFSGVLTSEGHGQWLRQSKNTPLVYDHLRALPELWRQGMAQGSPSNIRLAQLEERYGNLWKYVIADRNLGHGFLTETILPKTLLREKCGNQDTIFSCLQILFDYFEQHFEESRPDIVFFQVVAGAPALVAGAVAGRLKIPFVTLGKTKLDDRHHLASNVFMQPDEAIANFGNPDFQTGEWGKKRWVESMDAPPPTDHFLADQANHLRRHGQNTGTFLWKRATTLPQALKKWNKTYQRDPREATPWEQWKWEGRVQWNYKMLAKAGLFDCRKVEGDFAYFALGVTPEASTCVMAPDLADQLIAIGALARHLPAGWKLAVKDHLPMCGRRTRAFYEQAMCYPNVVWVDPTLRSTELICRARLTAVIGGTSGWEAIVLGKPVVTLAPVWYLATGLARYCSDLSRLHEDIRQALKIAEECKPEERRARVERMFQALHDGSFPLTYSQMWGNLNPNQWNDALPVWEHLANKIALAASTQSPSDPFETKLWTTPLRELCKIQQRNSI